MRYCFHNHKLERLYTDLSGARRYPSSVVDAFFEVVGIIDAAVDERDLYGLKGLHYEKLRGDMDGLYSLRLNRQYRLIVEWQEDAEGRYLVIRDIADYHR